MMDLQYIINDGVVDEFHDESGILLKIPMQLMTLLQISIQMMHQMLRYHLHNR